MAAPRPTPQIETRERIASELAFVRRRRLPRTEINAIRERLLPAMGLSPNHLNYAAFRTRESRNRALATASIYAAQEENMWDLDSEHTTMNSQHPAALIMQLRDQYVNMIQSNRDFLVTIEGTQLIDEVPRTVSITRPVNATFPYISTRWIESLIRGGYIFGEGDNEGSDVELRKLDGIRDVSVTLESFDRQNRASGGSFWMYWLDELFPEDLSSAQIYKKSQKIAMREKMKNGLPFEEDWAELDCLGAVLLSHDIGVEKMRKYFELSALTNSSFVPSNRIRQISEQLELNIQVFYYDASNQTRGRRCSEIYPHTPRKKKEKTSEIPIPRKDSTLLLYPNSPHINVGRMEDHYFADDLTDWTRVAASHHVEYREQLGPNLSKMIDEEDWKYACGVKKNSQGVVTGLKLASQEARKKKLTVGELLCILKYGAGGDKTVAGCKRDCNGNRKYHSQSSLMKLMDVDDIIMAGEEYEFFKKLFKEKDLPRMTEEEWTKFVDDNSKKEGKIPQCLLKGQILNKNHTYKYRSINYATGRKDFPALNNAIRKNGGPEKVFEEAAPWSFRDRFSIKAFYPICDHAGRKVREIWYDILLHYTVVAYDFESTTDGEEHYPFLCSIAYYEDDKGAVSFRDLTNISDELPENRWTMVKKSFWGVNCVDEVIRYLSSPLFEKVEICMIAHNMGYDLKFLIRHSSSLIDEGIFTSARSTKCACTKLRTSDGSQSVNVYHLDTLSLTQMKLEAFPKAYGLGELEKEIFPYNSYNEQVLSWKKEWLNVKFMALGLTKSNQTEEDLLECVKRVPNCYQYHKNTHFMNIKKFAIHYCERDVEILLRGFCKMRMGNYNLRLSEKEGSPICRLDIKDAISIPQFASHVLGMNGCFEGVYKFRGTLRDYICRAVVGGKCMIRGNIPCETKERVEDFDACSLYPTAMSRMKCPMGLPKQWTPAINLNDLSICQYFITVKITEVGIYRKFPLVSLKKEGGGRHFTNALIGKEVVFDKIQWEDAQKFQKINGIILCGLYFDGGGNDKIQNVMKNLYQERQLLKRAKNDAGQQCCKLVMNSAYGRMIMKPIELKTTFIENEEKIKHYISKHHSTTRGIHFFRKDLAFIEQTKSIYDHYSLPHCGASVLSWSKRVMNEVMCLAEDIGCEIYYQDTDSMHIREQDKKRLAEHFDFYYSDRGGLLAENGIPEALGRFHGDFVPIGARGYGAPISVESVYVGKKMYVDRLESTHEDGEENPPIQKYHIRMKGIPTEVIEQKCGSGKPFSTPIDLYRHLLNGAIEKFDLTSTSAASFDCGKDGSVKKRAKFEREIEMKKKHLINAAEEWANFFPEFPLPYTNNSVLANEMIRKKEEEDCILNRELMKRVACDNETNRISELLVQEEESNRAERERSLTEYLSRCENEHEDILDANEGDVYGIIEEEKESDNSFEYYLESEEDDMYDFDLVPENEFIY